MLPPEPVPDQRLADHAAGAAVRHPNRDGRDRPRQQHRSHDLRHRIRRWARRAPHRHPLEDASAELAGTPADGRPRTAAAALDPVPGRWAGGRWRVRGVSYRVAASAVSNVGFDHVR